jgi:hypothetical protein
VLLPATINLIAVGDGRKEGHQGVMPRKDTKEGTKEGKK